MLEIIKLSCAQDAAQIKTTIFKHTGTNSFLCFFLFFISFTRCFWDHVVCDVAVVGLWKSC